MADAQSSSSSAEVEGYVQQQQQQQPPVQFAPPLPPPESVRGRGHHGAVNEKSSRWSARDDIQLCDGLVTQKDLGRITSPSVFSQEAWEAMEELMKGSEILSGGARKSVAQCKARWQRLKIEYRIVKLLRQQPGFSWDENTQMVTAVAANWDAYIAEHKEAQPWRKKAFPCYSRVAFLVEGENGHDPGDEKFKRRWIAHAQSNLQNQPAKPRHRNRGTANASISSGEATPTPASSTSVFSVSVPPPPGASPNMPFTTQVVPGVSMTMPLNGGYSAIHQYRLPSAQANGKGNEKGSGAADNANADANPLQQQQQTDPYGQGQHTYTTGQIFYQPTPNSAPVPISVPIPQGAPLPQGTAPPPGVPVAFPPGTPASTSATSLAVAIQSVEESESLSDLDFVKAVQLFQRRAEVTEAYLAIQSKRARAMYLRAELEELAKASP